MAIWKNIEIENERGERVQASAPLIVSASRSTDIPAFYSDWFFNRLDKGYSVWRNPFNNKNSYVSYQNCRFIVFWSKNPKPLLGKLDKLKEKGINCYIQYTLNDYEYEMLEQGVPSLDERIETFKELSNKLGKDSVIWRFDPLMLTSRIGVVNLIEKIINIGKRIHEYTNKLVFSFSDIGVYDKVKRNLSNYGVDYREWTTDDMKAFAKSLQMVNEQLGWNLELATCSEKIDFDEYGIKHNSCVDDVLITKIAYNSAVNSVTRRQEYVPLANEDMLQSKALGQEEEEIRKTTLDTIRECVLSLPENYGRCVEMYFFHGLKYEEISEITGFPVNTIKSYIFRSKKLMADNLRGVIYEQ